MQNKVSYIWNFCGKLIPQVLFLLTNMILARYLTPKEFGAIGVLSIFVSLASTLTDSGLSGSLIKEKNISPLDCSSVFIFNLIISAGIYALLFLTSGLIEEFFKYQGLRYIVITLSAVFIIRAIGLVPRAMLTREIKFGVQAIISIVSVLFACVIAVIGGIQGWKSYSLVAYQLSYASVETLLLILFTKYKISFSFSFTSLKRLFSFGFFTTICNIIDTSYENLMSMLFGRYLGMSAAGYFSQAQKLEVASTNSLVQTLNSVSFPILTRKRDDLIVFCDESNSIQRFFIMMVFPLLLIVILFSTEIILLIYGQTWLESAPYLRLLIIVGMCYILESLDRNNIKSLGYVKALSNLTIIKRLIGIVMILLSLMISPTAMLYGYIASTALGFLLNKRLFCKITNKSFIDDLFRELKYVVAPLSVALIVGIIRIIHFEMISEILLVAVIVGSYYFILLRRNHISIKSILKK